MQVSICTLFEGDYHYGVGVLANSLYQRGYRGTIWVGYRGNLPPWAAKAKQNESYQELMVADGLILRFVYITADTYFSFYKPEFMQILWRDYCPEAEAMFYFDPDIVNRSLWDFYERWVQRGVALCEDAWPYFLTSNHPIRLAWRDYIETKGYPCLRLLERYYNAGFVGIHKDHASILPLWSTLITLFRNDDAYMSRGSDHRYPYINLHDQDALNIALMVSTYPMSTVGPEGMDFTTRGFLMSHAAGANVVKPWRKKLIVKALGGVPPSHTDKLFWQHAASPLPVYSHRYVARKQLALRIASAIGRFIRRS